MVPVIVGITDFIERRLRLKVLGRHDIRPRHGKATDAADPLHVARAADCGADRVELYTGPYAEAHAAGDAGVQGDDLGQGDWRAGVVAMGQQYNLGGGYPATNFTGGDINTTVATGNYNDGATVRTITGPHSANSWRLSAGANQDFTFVNAPITLGVGIITNNGSTITLQGDTSVSSLTAAGSDLYVYTNQGTMNLNMTLTGAMNFVKSGGGTLALRPPSSPVSNDYLGTTFVNQGTLNLNAPPGGYVLIPGDIVVSGWGSGANTTVAMLNNQSQIAATSSISLLGGANLTGFAGVGGIAAAASAACSVSAALAGTSVAP